MSVIQKYSPTAPLKVLSLSGGGARGIFQARFLERLEARLSSPLRAHFDLIAATSTGAIVGLGIAAGLPCARIADLFRNHATDVFRPRLLASVRRGPRYDVARLERLLKAEFGDRTLGDLDIDVFIPSSVVDTQEGRYFTRDDSDASLVDVALASAAAPTYFAPRRITNDNRGYSDGGLWANDPGFAAIAHAVSSRAIHPDSLVLVSIGTGRVQRGEPATALTQLRPLSPSAIRFIFELLGSLQAWQAQQLITFFLNREQVIEVNPYLPRWIPLDHGREALLRLPALADSQADQYCSRIEDLLARPSTVSVPDSLLRSTVNPIAVAGISAANLRTFIPARKYYAQFRGGRESITMFIAQASEELLMVSVNLMTGDAFEKILDTFGTMLNSSVPPPTITLSLLDPKEDYLMKSISGNLDIGYKNLAESIDELIIKVGAFYNLLSYEQQGFFKLHCHKTVPSASAILIDPHREWGSIQLETKSYKARTIDAFGFEVGYGSDLFNTLRRSYIKLVADGRIIY